MAALTKTLIKANETEAVVKIAGSDTAASVIALATDILATGQTVTGTPKVNIIGVQWSGEAGGAIKIARNGTRIMSLVTDNPGYMDMMGTEIPPDNINNTNDISVTITNSSNAAVQGEVYLRLRKTSGYGSPAYNAGNN